MLLDLPLNEDCTAITFDLPLVTVFLVLHKLVIDEYLLAAMVDAREACLLKLFISESVDFFELCILATQGTSQAFLRTEGPSPWTLRLDPELNAFATEGSLA